MKHKIISWFWKGDRKYFLLIAIFVILPHIAVAIAPVDTMLNWFNTDDAFYYYKVAQNIVAGKGITFDGLGLTNGFHPLWMLVLLPVFAFSGSNLILPLRIVIGLQTLLSVLSACLFFALLRKRTSGWIALSLSLSLVLLPQLHSFINKGGTEAGLNLVMLLVFWTGLTKWMPQADEKGSIKPAFKTGALALLPLFARLDNAILLGVIGIWLVSVFLVDRVRAKAMNKAMVLKTIGLGVGYFSPWGAFLVLYMLVNRLVFGTFMPVSGLVKRWWGVLNFTVYGKPAASLGESLGKVFSPVASQGPFSLVVAPLLQKYSFMKELFGRSAGKVVSAGLGIVLLAILIWLIADNIARIKQQIADWYLLPLALGCSAHLAYYQYSGQVALKEWYWVAENLFLFFTAALLLDSLDRKWHSMSKRQVFGAVVAVLWLAWLWLPHLGRAAKYLAAEPSEGRQYYLLRASWLEKNTEPGALIGMTGAGSTAYFIHDRTIVNLDGLISTADYFRSLQKSNADEYLAVHGLQYVFGNPDILLGSNPYQWIFEDHLSEYRTFVFGEKELILWRFR